MATITQIDQLLPQTQCTKCGFKDCLDYAKAIHNGSAHNQCPPGGQKGIEKLSKLLNREILPLNPENGTEAKKTVAVINEDLCIGCTKCIQACPVDAISGASRLMHAVIADECTGCDLCVEPCPMDCIDMVEITLNKQPENLNLETYEAQKNHYRNRHNDKIKRLHIEKQYDRTRHIKNKHKPIKQQASENDLNTDKKAKQDYIKEALTQFRAKKKNQK